MPPRKISATIGSSHATHRRLSLERATSHTEANNSAVETMSTRMAGGKEPVPAMAFPNPRPASTKPAPPASPRVQASHRLGRLHPSGRRPALRDLGSWTAACPRSLPGSRRAISHAPTRAMAPRSAGRPFHFEANPAPNANPAAKRHGRHSGEGTRRLGGGGSGGASGSGSPIWGGGSGSGSGRGGVRRSMYRRSSTTNRNPSTTQNATKMSGSATRDCTNSRLSVAMSNPVRNAHSTLPNSRYASSASNTTVAVPNSAAENRQPNGVNPNSLIPIATIHLPSGGWTQDCSESFVRSHFWNWSPAYRQPSFA